MLYVDYWKSLAQDPKVDLEKFTYRVLPFKFETQEIHEVLFKDVDSIKAEAWIKKVPYKKEYLPLLMPVFNTLLSYLEEEIFSCKVLVDNVNIYRTILAERTSSALYHYDNTPPTVLKVMVYLTDVVDDTDGPIEFCENLVIEPSRLGPGKWGPPPNGSRLTDEQVSSYRKVKIYGETGTSILFYPSCVHRANPPATGKFRDVINIIFRPTHLNDTFDWISGYESHGIPVMDPRDRTL